MIPLNAMQTIPANPLLFLCVRLPQNSFQSSFGSGSGGVENTRRFECSWAMKNHCNSLIFDWLIFMRPNENSNAVQHMQHVVVVDEAETGNWIDVLPGTEC